jgi:hypothetical protein
VTDTPDTAALVGEAKELLAKATPGPWLVGYSVTEGDVWRLYAADLDIADADNQADAALIARAPTLIAQLCDEVERLQDRITARARAEREVQR